MKTVLSILLGLTLAGGCDQLKPKAAPTSQPAMPPPAVTVATAETRDVPVYLDEIGACVARETVAIKSQVSGQVTKIHFTDGADLKPGDDLFTIDPRPYEAQLAQAQAMLAEHRAVSDLAKIEFRRVSDMIANKTASQQEYDARKSAIDVAEARIKSDEAAIDAAKLNLNYCIIKSPMQGRAGERQVDAGNVVIANNPMGNQSMLVIQRLDPIYADFTITEGNLSRVQKNMAEGTLRVEVRLPDDDADKTRVGTLTFLDNAVQEGAGTVKLRATLPNEDRHFWPGRFVKVRLVLSTIKDAVLAPNTAVQVSADGLYVYVVNKNSIAERRLVKLGQRQDDRVVVSEGLAAGERVIIAGHMMVIPNTAVNPMMPGAATRPTTQSEPSTQPSGDHP